MPITYRIEGGVIYSTCAGVLDDASVAAHAQALMREPLHGPEVPELLDLRDVTQIDLTGRGPRAAAEILRHDEGAPSAKVAIVVSSKVAYGMARMYEMLRDDIEVKVFEDYDYAVAWLKDIDREAC